jgi:hypothetical protein
MNTLSAMITGIIIGKDIQLTKIAANVAELIKMTSSEKRIKRLVINDKVTETTHFLTSFREKTYSKYIVIAQAPCQGL